MIKVLQISPFDYCNNKCWYCPKRYYEQPKEYIQHMSPELFEKIIKNIVEEKGNVVSNEFNFIYTGMYNEILLYKYFPEMLEILRKYGIKTIILTNGTTITKDKVDLIDKYKDVVVGINFNIPAFEKDIWCEYTSRTPEDFDLMIENLKYVSEKIADYYKLGMSIGVNGIDSVKVNKQVEEGKKIFNNIQIYPVIGLGDRAGLLHDKGVLSNQAYIEKNKLITGCNNGNRTEEWLHVNSLGKVFICCNDYFFKYEFGDFNIQELKDIWNSKKHKEFLKQAKENLCSRCSYAKRENKRPILTIGMASYNNFEQVWWTIQSLRLYHNLDDVEILVIDNYGDDVLKERIQNSFFDKVKYIRKTEIQGTSYPRDKVFEEASGEFVLCIDSHVMFPNGTIDKLKKWIVENRGRKDLFQGILVYDDLKTFCDRMNPIWECNMFGVWGYIKEIAEKEYEIPMNGLGLFGCYKEAWLGFNEEFREFGGEEGYIHEKYKQAGNKIICLPFLQWIHKFHDQKTTTPYLNTITGRIRNYIIGWDELGLDLQPIKDHFSQYNIEFTKKEEDGIIKKDIKILIK